MTEVKWIKILVNIFDDEKIQYIETMPNGDEIIVIWFRLMCLAGKSNNSGLLMMTDKIPYTDEMLSAIFKRDVKSINMALSVFENLDMIEVTDNAIYLTNWEKHQNVDGMEKIKLSNRERQQRFRDNKKVTDSNVTVTLPSRTSSISNSLYIYKDNKDKKNIYGIYSNVLLSEEEYIKLKEEFPKDYEQRIERLSEYIASTGKKYKSHIATIRMWARKDKQETKSTKVDISW